MNGAAGAIGSNRLWLGTAQFGLAYGATNRGGRVATAEVAAILDLAEQVGVTVLDTAPAYGDCESVLGEIGAAKRFRIVTKTVQLTASSVGETECDQVECAFNRSLDALETHHVAALLVHGPDDLLLPGADRLFGLLDGFRRQGHAGRIGVSVYDPAELLQIIDRYPIQIAQIPVNAFDQRFLDPGLLSRCRERGVALCARSAFLQGLLLADPDEMPAGFDRFRTPVAHWRTAVGQTRAELLQACLSVALRSDAIEATICGVTSLAELGQILDALASEPSVSPAFDRFAVDDASLIDPRTW